jgi:hypothetical protein
MRSTLLFLVLLGTASASAPAPATPKLESELRDADLEHARATQDGNRARLDELLRPAFANHTANGRFVDREQMIEAVASGSLRAERFVRSHDRVVVAGSAGYVFGQDRLEAPPPLATRGERTRPYTHVWTRVGGRWRLLARHFHLIP